MRFWIRVYVRSGSTFSFQTKKEELIHGLLNITESDAIFNFTDAGFAAHEWGGAVERPKGEIP